MAMTKIFSCFLLVLHPTFCFEPVCFSALCLKCIDTDTNMTNSCPLCSTKCINESLVLPDCKKNFSVTINSTESKVNEGDDVTLTCLHNFPMNVSLTFGWKMQHAKPLRNENRSQLVLKKVLSNKAGQYLCFVNSSCGNAESSPHGVTVNNNGVVILVVCGISALVLVLLMGITMKYKLKRENAKHRERMMQRQQDQQRASPAPITPRES